MSKCLVLGGAGFIGQNIVKRLLKDGHEVTVIDNFEFGKRETIPEGVKVIEHDINNWIGMSEPIDYIFHFAGPSSVIQFNKDPAKCVRTTLHGFSNVLWLARVKNATLIYPSSGTVYSGTDGICQEFADTKPINLYAICKKICEDMALHARDVRSTGFRIFAGYGPGEEHKGDIASAVTIFMNNLKNNEAPTIWGDGTQTRDFVYIDDIVEAVVSVMKMEGKLPPYVNLGSGKAYSFNAILSILTLIMNKSIQPTYVPKPKTYVEKTLADVTLFKMIYKFIPRDIEAGLKSYLNTENQ
jgi:UDP-glucose 4-epimerase